MSSYNPEDLAAQDIWGNTMLQIPNSQIQGEKEKAKQAMGKTCAPGSVTPT
jgi:hypothetical protein